MPIIDSAKKAVRQNIKRRKANRRKKDLLTREISKIKKGQSSNLNSLFSLADRAAKSGTIHRKKAARLKSRLAKRLDTRLHNTQP